jgi:hypothetical protein
MSTVKAESSLGVIFNQRRMDVSEGIWVFDEDDWLLMALLQDEVYMAELLFSDVKNYEYGGCYHVRDYQYPLFRPEVPYEGYPCARKVGKTESIKARGVCHAFKRQSEDLLLTAPYLIHLKPLTDAIEDRIRGIRLTREFLDTSNQRTGFQHNPFQVNFADGTKIMGRIPHTDGHGVKGMHVPDLLIDEGQDYPEAGWTEVHETVNKDHVDRDGEPDFTYHFFGVHAGGREGKFYKLASSGEFKIRQITAMMRPNWSAEEKRKAAAMYGGIQSPDYKRNILGEAGAAASAFFVISRLMACMDQNPESEYNTREWLKQSFVAEETFSMLPDDIDKAQRKGAIFDLMSSLLDLPDLGQQVYCGMDVGLLNDPTVITIWDVGTDTKKRSRLKLRRMIHLWRFDEAAIRIVTYIIGWKYGARLRGFGQDITGLGLPLYMAMESDETAPQSLLDVSKGYVFNAKSPIGIDPSLVTQDSNGRLRDQYGTMVQVEEDDWGQKRYVVMMAMIEASTRFLRKYVDDQFILLPFDSDVIADMQGETEQRVRAMAGLPGGAKKANAFHILDSMRTMAMVREAAEIEEQLRVADHEPVLARAMLGPGAGGGLQLTRPGM